MRSNKAIHPLRHLPRHPQREEHRQRHSLREGWREFIEDHDWDHFVTLTSVTPMSREMLISAFVESFLRSVGGAAHRKVGAFLAVEGGGFQRFHLHALLVGSRGLQRDQLQLLWGRGNVHAGVFLPGIRGEAYVTKMALRDADSLDVFGHIRPRSLKRWMRNG